MNCLADVDCYNITEMRNNAKRVHKAGENFGLGGTNEVYKRRLREDVKRTFKK